MLYPMFALVAFVFLFIVCQFILRLKSVRSRAVSLSYYRVFQSKDAEIPTQILAGGRHLSNMFETPVLFYVVSVLAIVLQVETLWMITLGWVYVGARIVHAYIHAVYNNIIHRMLIFWLGMIVLLLMWVTLVISASATAV